MMEDKLRNAVLYVVPFLMALSLHEMMHAWVADRFGDRTGRMLGRVTLNPLAHLDWLGTVIFPLLSLFLSSTIGGIFFGWAKPVPVNPINLKNPRKDMAIIALAGPASNIALAFLCAIFLGFGSMTRCFDTPASFFWPIGGMLARGIVINLFLGVFNLLPFAPLDGAAVFMGILPKPLGNMLRGLVPYGGAILILLAFSGLLGVIAYPVFGLMDLMVHVSGAAFNVPLPQVFQVLIQR